LIRFQTKRLLPDRGPERPAPYRRRAPRHLREMMARGCGLPGTEPVCNRGVFFASTRQPRCAGGRGNRIEAGSRRYLKLVESWRAGCSGRRKFPSRAGLHRTIRSSPFRDFRATFHVCEGCLSRQPLGSLQSSETPPYENFPPACLNLSRTIPVARRLQSNCAARSRSHTWGRSRSSDTPSRFTTGR